MPLEVIEQKQSYQTKQTKNKMNKIKTFSRQQWDEGNKNRNK
jgi:hypothetical protein